MIQSTKMEPPLGTMIPCDPSLGELCAGNLTDIPLPPPTGSFTLYFDGNSMEKLWLALTWGKAD